MELRTRHIFTLKIEPGAPQQVGAVPSGGRLLVMPILGGTFEGERLKGTVEPGGSNWITIRADGALTLDARFVLKTHDGALIGTTYRGLRHGPADVMAKLGRGEPVDSSLYYFRAATFFETASETYSWLNRMVAVTIGERPPTGPVNAVYEVL
jgi:hypothetical protein